MAHALAVNPEVMEWREKRPKDAEANIKKRGDRWEVRVKLLLPNKEVFETQRWADSKTAARKLRDLVFEAFNARAIEILTAAGESLLPPERPRLSLQDLAEKCRDEWWPARGRSTDISEQYFQKLDDYCIPVLGADKPIDQITPDDWDLILQKAKTATSQFARPLSESTLRKIKACLSSALSCAVSQKYLSVNPLKGLPYNPHPVSEADRLGKDVEALRDEDAPAKRMLTDAEASVLLEKSKGTLAYPMVVLQLALGLRIAEALAVKWSDFDFNGKELRVRFQTKRRKNAAYALGNGSPKSVLQRVRYLKSKAGFRNVYLFEDALALLATLTKGSDDDLVCPCETGGLMEPRNAQRIFHNILKEAALKGEQPTTHSLRSWRLSHWANILAIPASQLQRVAGHSRIETTLKYYVRGDTASLTQWLDGRALPASPLASRPLPPADRGESGQPLQSE